MIDSGSQALLCDIPIRYDTYQGCQFGCAYCYVSKKVDMSKVKAQASLGSLREFIAGKRIQTVSWCDWNIPLHWGGVSDPFQTVELKYRASLEALKVFAETQYPVVISTKGVDVLVEKEYLDVLKKCRAVVQVSMVAPSFDVVEKGAPPYETRMKALPLISKNCLRLVIRLQPYHPSALGSVMGDMTRWKKAGVHGFVLEGMKQTGTVAGMVKLGSENVWPVEVLRRHISALRAEAHRQGMQFHVGENRLRHMGDSLACCGYEGVEGFVGNHYNLNRLYSANPPEPTPAMKKPGSAVVFKTILQESGIHSFLKRTSFEEMMLYFRERPFYKRMMGTMRYLDRQAKNHDKETKGTQE